MRSCSFTQHACAGGLVLAMSAVPAFAGACPTDFDGNGSTDFADLLAIITAWGPCEACPEDLDASGDVGFGDLLGVLSAWGPCPECVLQFVYPPGQVDSEAEQIGYEMLGPGGDLVLSDEVYDRIVQDLAAIRSGPWSLEGFVHFCQWVRTEMLVGVDPKGPLDDYNAMNCFYGAEVLDSYFGGSIVLLGFPGDVNIPALAALYAAETEVEYAEPNGIFGASGGRWEPTDLGGGLWQWIVTVGWWDCFDGCDCQRVHLFLTDEDGSVTLFNFAESLAPHCPPLPTPPTPEELAAIEALCNY